MAIRDTLLPAQGSTSWYSHYSQMDAGLRDLDGRGVYLDSFSGSTDDAKLTAAMSYCSAQTYRPPILLKAKQYTFSTPRTLYHGFALLGVPGMSNAEVGSATGTKKTHVQTSVSNGVWLSSGGSTYNDRMWDVTIRNIAFNGTSTTQWMGGPAALWCMNLRDLSFNGYKTILGSQSATLPIDMCLMDGWLSFNNSYNGAIHIAGSDNTLFVGTTNLDSTPAHATAGNANGQYHLWLDYLDKSTIGPIYITAETNWGAVRVTGAGYNTSGQGSVGITGAKIEGRNKNAPCNGNLIRVDGAHLYLRDTWLGFAMASPTSPGHSITDAGICHQTDGKLLLSGCTYGRATGVSESVPLVYSTGGEAQATNIFTSANGGTWTGRPRVTGPKIQVYDASVSKV